MKRDLLIKREPKKEEKLKEKETIKRELPIKILSGKEFILKFNELYRLYKKETDIYKKHTYDYSLIIEYYCRNYRKLRLWRWRLRSL